MCLQFKPRPLVVHIDEYVKNLEAARSEADNARKEWASHREERQKTEIERLKKLDIPDLSKKAVSILARHETPDYIVNKAIDATEKDLKSKVREPIWNPITPPDKKIFWSMVYRETIDENHDWWIERNKGFKQYRRWFALCPGFW